MAGPLMTQFHKDVLRKAFKDASESMNAIEVLNHLYSDGTLSFQEKARIKRQAGQTEQNDELLDIISRGKPDGAYHRFRSALAETGQTQVVKILDHAEAEVHDEYKAKRKMEKERRQRHLEQQDGRSCLYPNEPLVDETAKLPAPDSQALVPVCTALARLTKRRPPKQSTVARRSGGGARSDHCQPPNIHIQDGCTVGIRVSIDTVGIRGRGEYEWSLEIANAIGLDLELYIWEMLNNHFKRLETRTHGETAHCLRELEHNGRSIKHIGLDPLQIIVHCDKLSSLNELIKMEDKNSIAKSLENALMTDPFKTKRGLERLILETQIDEYEKKFCERVLQHKERTVELHVSHLPVNDMHPMIRESFEHDLYDESVRQSRTPGTQFEAVLDTSGIEVVGTKKSCVLFTLRFLATDDLEFFKENLDSGLLTEVFEEALLTDNLRNKYHLDKLHLSLSLQDPCDYEMCWAELACFEDQMNCGNSTERVEDEEADLSDVADKENEPQKCCHEKIYLIEELKRANRKWKEKCISLKQELTKLRKTVVVTSPSPCTNSGELGSLYPEDSFGASVHENRTMDVRARTEYPQKTTVKNHRIAEEESLEHLRQKVVRLEQEKEHLSKVLRERDAKEGYYSYISSRTDLSIQDFKNLLLPNLTNSLKGINRATQHIDLEAVLVSLPMWKQVKTLLEEVSQTGTDRGPYPDVRVTTSSETIGGLQLQSNTSAAEHEANPTLDSNQVSTLQEKVEELTKETAWLRHRELALTENLNDIRERLRKVPLSSIEMCEYDDNLRQWHGLVLAWSGTPPNHKTGFHCP